jgi:DNA primase
MENNIINIVNDINEKIDIVKVIGEHINLKKKGNSYVGLCPFHQDSNPSLSVHPTKKIFKCFVCGAKGSAISFVQQIKKITFLEALKNVCDTNNIDLKKYHLETKNSYLDEKLKYLYNVNLHVLKYYQGFLLKKENAFALNYLHKRHLDKKIIDYFKIGYAPNNSLIHKICTNDKNMFGSDYDQSLV